MYKKSKISFHKFPRAEGLQQKWIKFTRKQIPFDPNKSFICSHRILLQKKSTIILSASILPAEPFSKSSKNKHTTKRIEE
jgi:hypothetical protein